MKSVSAHQRQNPKQISYEVFFQNPSGISEDFAERSDEEDDLLENQNKSNTVIEDDNDQINIIDEIDHNKNAQIEE